MVLDLLGKAILLLKLVELVIERDDALGREILDFLGPLSLPVPDVGCREGAQRPAGPDGRFDRRVEVGVDDTVRVYRVRR